MSNDRTNGARPNGRAAQRSTVRQHSSVRTDRSAAATGRSAYAPGARMYSDKRSRVQNTAARKASTQGKRSLLERIFSAFRRFGRMVAGAAAGFYHLFDRFRTSQSKSIVTNTLLFGVLTLILACIFMLAKPAIDASIAARQAEKGNTVEAMQLLSQAEKEGLEGARLDRARLRLAVAFTGQGSYALARQMTGEMKDAAMAAEQNRNIDYAEATQLYSDRSYQSAAQLFYRLGNYLDSADRYRDCLCAVAVQAYLDGSEARSRSLLAEMEDAENRLSRVLKDMGHMELAADPLFSAENLKHMRESYAQLQQSRQTVQKGRIAAGARHSLALKRDGTVLAQGDNSLGQCNVGTWNTVTMLAAGRMHSVGLRADGTVVACGDNSEGQCNVGAWSDIVAVAAGAYSTVGLKQDGSVVCCGRGYRALDSWQDVKTVTAGGYCIAALTENGTMLSSHSAALLPVDVRMFDVAVCGQVSAGILYDGSLISSVQNAPDWRELKSTAVSETGIFALTLDGEVKAQYFRSGDNFNIRVPSGAEEIAVSGSHALVLMNDGRIYAFGDNSYGQCLINGASR